MIRVIGDFQPRSPKNSRVKAFMEWLSKFDGCTFTSMDWKHFQTKVKERMDYYNREVKDGGYRISVSFHKGQISVTCGNGNGEPISQLYITVIPWRSEYSRQLGEAVPYDDCLDEDEEGGEL